MPKSPADPSISGPSRQGLRWLGFLSLAAFPAVLVGIVYYGPYLSGQKGLRGARGDAAFYTWQAWRAGRLLDGQWWRLAEPLGPPQYYPPDNARRPHVFEGVDALLLSVITTRLFPTPALPESDDLTKQISSEGAADFTPAQKRTLLSPIRHFNLLTVIILLANAWTAAWLVYRHTGSYWWSGLAEVLITLNWPTALQAGGHLHLYKHFWVLAVVVTAFLFWERPTWGRAALLGLCMGLLVQGSWHFAFFLLVALMMLLAILVLRGSLHRPHASGLLIAALAAAAIGGPLTAPYWAPGSRAQEQFEKRDLRDVLWFSSELSQYVIPFWSDPGELYHSARQRYSEDAADREIWNYPGALVLMTLVGYGVWLLRRRDEGDRERRWIDYLALLSGLLVFLSMAGGISILMFKFFPQFRAYGRAGLMAVGLWAVLVPVLLSRYSHQWSSISRWTFATVCMVLALADGWQCRLAWDRPESEEALHIPGWVPWLARQPIDVRAAVFPYVIESREHLYWWLFHRHAVLNTCDFRPYEEDVVAAGGDLEEELSPLILNLLRQRGYFLLVLDEQLWKAHPWIDSAEQVTLLEEDQAGQWRIYALESPGQM